MSYDFLFYYLIFVVNGNIYDDFNDDFIIFNDNIS